MKEIRDEKLFDKYIRVFLILSSFLHGINALSQQNLLQKYAGQTVSTILAILCLCAGIYACTDMTYYLPFLGDTVFPTGLMAKKVVPNGADMSVKVELAPFTKVIYWAAEPCYMDCENPVTAYEAYKDYTNSGIATTDQFGVAYLQVKGPQSYRSDAISPPVHYRIVRENGMLSKIYTTNL